MNGKIDWKFALDAVGGSTDLLIEIIEIFFDEYPKLIAEIQSSIASESLPQLQRSAHTLKGCLRYFGQTQAGQLSFELEVMGRDGKIETAAKVFGDLQTEVESLIPELKTFVATQPPESDA